MAFDFLSLRASTKHEMSDSEMDYTPMHLINQLTIELSCMMPSNITFFLRKWMLYHLAWFLTKPKNLVSKRKSFWRLDLGVIREWRRHFILFQTISAQCEKEPCCDWVGDEGAGHFVKMVHNGIEYGDMQLIAGLASDTIFLKTILLEMYFLDFQE